MSHPEVDAVRGGHQPRSRSLRFRSLSGLTLCKGNLHILLLLPYVTPDKVLHLEKPVFGNRDVNKKVTTSQRIGEIGEKAANLQFLRIGFQFDGRSRLEAGIDGIAEVMDDDQPTAKMIAVQVKATERGSYVGETNAGFTYRVRASDFNYLNWPHFRPDTWA